MNTDLPNSIFRKEKLIPIGEAAEVLGVSIDTVRRWDKAGILHSTRPDGKNRYFSLKELEEHKFNKPLSISEASEKLSISPSTLRRLEKKGVIQAERNTAGERIYNEKVLEDFLNSSYFLRKKEVQEAILDTLKSGDNLEVSKQEKDSPKKIKEEVEYKEDNLSHRFLATEVDRLNVFKKSFYTSGLILATTFIIIIFIITIFFLLFPESTGAFFGYRKIIIGTTPIGENTTNSTPILGATTPSNQSVSATVVTSILKPFSKISLGIVKAVSPEVYKRAVPVKQVDVNQVLTLNESGNVEFYNPVELNNNDFLKITDSSGIAKNLNAELLQGKEPGKLPNNLVYLNSNGQVDFSLLEIPNESLTGTQIKNDTIKNEDIINGAVNSDKILDESITTSDLNSVLTFSSGDLIDLSAITHSSTSKQGLILPNTSSASPSNPSSGEGYLAYDATGDQVIVYNGSSWQAVGTSLSLYTGSADNTTTSSVSGLELISSNQLSLIRGCGNGELLKWNDATKVWTCSTDVGAGGAGISTIKENDVSKVTSAVAIDFSGTDFIVTDQGLGEGGIAIDYTNSKITQSDQTESITGAWDFSNISFGDTNIPLTGGDTTLDITGAATRTLNILNSTASQIANFNNGN